MRNLRVRTTVLTSVAAFLLVVVAGCGDGSDAASEPPQEPPVVSDAGVAFQANHVRTVVAGTGHGWLIQRSADGAAVLDVDIEGRTTELVVLPGEAHQFVPFRDHLAATYYTCEGDPCSQTVVYLTVVDSGGSIIDEHELLRLDHPPGSAEGGRLIGASDDVIWVAIESSTVAYDPLAGREVSRADGFRYPCLMGDELFTLVRVGDEPPVGFETTEDDGPPVQIEIQHLVHDTWQTVPGSQRSVQQVDLVGEICLAGVINTGRSTEPGMTWDPSGWHERDPFMSGFITVSDRGQDNQLFSIVSDGVIQRMYRESDEVPLAVERFELPSEHFRHDTSNIPPAMQVDQSDDIRIGCIQQPPPGPLDLENPPSPAEFRTPYDCSIGSVAP